MDCDLSTDLSLFPLLIDSLIIEGYDIAVGSRLLPGALTTRCLKREMISRCYNLLVRCLFKTSFSDAQCGFKAITKHTFKKVEPMLLNNTWFLDTELLLLADRVGCRIFDFPVKWIEDQSSTVNIFSTAIDDLRGLIRLKKQFANDKWLKANVSR
jgi:hypothetical protein